MTIAELADYLRLPQATLYRLAREGAIPGVKVGRNWRFHRKAVEQWLGVSTGDHTGQSQSEEMGAQFGSNECFDISEQAEQGGKFDVRLNQLASGKFHGIVEFVKTPGMMIYEQRWLRKAEAWGTTPEGYITLATNAAWQRSEITWCGTTVNHLRFACGGPGAEIDFILPDQCHNTVLLVKPEILACALDQETVDSLLVSKTIEFTGGAGQQLINAITGNIRRYAKNPKLLDNPFAGRSLEFRVLNTLSICLEQSGREGQSQPISRHKASVRRAIAHIESSVGPLTALELAIAVGVSQRTLEHAFREVLETTPASYLRFHRLNAAHRELVSADPKTSTITGIAIKWGFTHPGRFSSAHRELFGEAPSDALNGARVSPTTQIVSPA